MTLSQTVETLPRPLRRLLNLLRRLPFSPSLLGERPVEPAVMRLYSQHIGKNDVVVEVGARMGDGTRVLANISAHVYSFEPARQSFLVLRTMMRTHHNVDTYNMALGESSGVANLNRDRSFSGVASIKKLADVDYVAQEKVRVATLDSLRFRYPPTSLVLDCEGYELEVLRGATHTMSNLRSVLVETHRLSDGSDTLNAVVNELARHFPLVTTEYVGNDCWVVGHK